MADTRLLSHLGRLNQTLHRPDTPRGCGSGVRPSHKMAASTQYTREHQTKVDRKLSGRESEAGGCQPRWIKIGQPATQTASANS